MRNTWTVIEPQNIANYGITAACQWEVPGQPSWPIVAYYVNPTYDVSVLNLYYPNSAEVYCVYQTQRVGNRGYRKRIKTVNLFGTGTVQSGSVVVGIDGGVTTYTPSTLPLTPAQGIPGFVAGALLTFGCTQDVTGYVFDVTFTLTGVNLQITDCVISYEEVEAEEG